MATHTPIRSSVAVALTAAALLAGTVRPAAAVRSGCGGTTTLLAADTSVSLGVTETRRFAASVAPAYGWPVKPFDRPHPVRANFDDPRIGAGGSESFHFGIDVAAPDRAPVYAVTGGIAYVRPGSVAVALSDTHAFGYWHVRAVVRNHQSIHRYQLLGYVIPGWEHVHFAERVDGVYLNPLRPGALGPYVDRTPPEIGEISLSRRRRGGFEVFANAYDTPSLRVPGAWANEPVSPALLQWRISRNDHLGRWRTAADFRTALLTAVRFHSVYAPPTRQNHKGAAGYYCFFLPHRWKPADGSYRIEVAASDIRGNRTAARLDLIVAHGEVRT